MRRALILLLPLILFCGACRDKEMKGEIPHEPKNADENLIDQATDTAPRGQFAPQASAPTIAPYDRVILDLTVVHPPYIFLTSLDDSPVTVKPVIREGWNFEQKIYKLTTSYFPLEIPFRINRRVTPGNVVLSLAMQIEYMHKSDENNPNAKTMIRNDLFNIPIRIAPYTGSPKRTVHLPITYDLELGSEITEKEVE